MCLRIVHVFLFSFLTQGGEGVSGGNMDVLCLLLILTTILEICMTVPVT